MRKQRRRSAVAVTAQADQRLSFRYTDSIIPLLPKSEISSPLAIFSDCRSPVCVGAGRKPRRPVFWRRGSYSMLQCWQKDNRRKTRNKDIWAPAWENQQFGFWPDLTQTRLYSNWRWLEAWNFVFRKKRYCFIQVAKTKALVSFAIIRGYREAELRLCFPHMQIVGFLTQGLKLWWKLSLFNQVVEWNLRMCYKARGSSRYNAIALNLKIDGCKIYSLRQVKQKLRTPFVNKKISEEIYYSRKPTLFERKHHANEASFWENPSSWFLTRSQHKTGFETTDDG